MIFDVQLAESLKLDAKVQSCVHRLSSRVVD